MLTLLQIPTDKEMNNYFQKQMSIYPLVTFRVTFGALMIFGTLRFLFNGWIEKLYYEPVFFFKYFGFEWVIYPGDEWMYPLYILMLLSAVGILLGWFYRASAISFFLLFTYTELIDATNYLNHHYLVALFAFYLCFLPAHRNVSLDTLWRGKKGFKKIPRWNVDLIKAQIVLVYTCAGIAKLSPDWLYYGMPLSIWIPEHKDMPILGALFGLPWMGLIMSWGGAIYDLLVGWLLLWGPTRIWAYGAVILFHLFTYLLFNIGLFPQIMVLSNLIFFAPSWHEKLYKGWKLNTEIKMQNTKRIFPFQWILMGVIFMQVLLPFRHWLYPGDVLWTEEGYRWSWRVMLVEKAGYAQFKVKDGISGRASMIQNGHYLTDFQEKQMCIQPDFILQYAHFLGKEYEERLGVHDAEVYADVQVALNSRVSKTLVDPQVNLMVVKDGLKSKSWILR